MWRRSERRDRLRNPCPNPASFLAPSDCRTQGLSRLAASGGYPEQSGGISVAGSEPDADTYRENLPPSTPPCPERRDGGILVVYATARNKVFGFRPLRVSNPHIV